MRHDLSRSLPLPYLDDIQRGYAVCQEGEIFANQTVLARDGVPLSVFSAGEPDLPVILLVNALGVSCLFLTRLARVLGTKYRVLTWEARGLPDERTLPFDADASLARHAADLADILAWSRPVRLVAVVTFCSGVNVALYAMAMGVLDVDRLCIVSPSIELAAATERSEYQQTMMPLWRKVAASGVRMAGLVRVLLEQGQPTDRDAAVRELWALNALPFRSAESTLRYARMQAACLDLDAASFLPQLRLPVLVLHGEQDELIHLATPSALAAAIPGARVQIVADAGHFAVHSSAELQSEVMAFVHGASSVTQLGGSGVHDRHA